MKTTHTCPKCASNAVYRIPNGLTSDADPRIHQGWTRRDIAITRYVCGQCGYLEEWVTSQQDLQALMDSFGQQSSSVPEPRFVPDFEEVDPNRCPACGADITPADRICPSCGINFGRPQGATS